MSYTDRDFPLRTLELFDYMPEAYSHLGDGIRCPVNGFDALMYVQKAIDSKDPDHWRLLMYTFGHTYVLLCLGWFEGQEDYELCEVIKKGILSHNERCQDNLPTNEYCLKNLQHLNKGL